MRLLLRKIATMLAIYAVALHVILLGFAPIAASGASAADPFSVICHSFQSADSADLTSDKPDLVPGQFIPGQFTPGHACEHCNLCSTMAPPEAPESALVGTIAPSNVLDVLRPLSTARRAGISSLPNLARGPPRFA